MDEFLMSAVPTVIFGKNHLGAMENQRCSGFSIVMGRIVRGSSVLLSWPPNLSSLLASTPKVLSSETSDSEISHCTRSSQRSDAPSITSQGSKPRSHKGVIPVDQISRPQTTLGMNREWLGYMKLASQLTPLPQIEQTHFISRDQMDPEQDSLNQPPVQFLPKGIFHPTCDSGNPDILQTTCLT